MCLKSREAGQTESLRAGGCRQWTALVVAVLLLSSTFLAACGGNGPPKTTDPDILRGETVFKRECASCHSTKSEVTIVGPSMAGIANRAPLRMEGLNARDYIHLSIIKPGEYVVDGFVDQMPDNFGTSLSDEDMEGVITYLLTLE